MARVTESVYVTADDGSVTFISAGGEVPTGVTVGDHLLARADEGDAKSDAPKAPAKRQAK